MRRPALIDPMRPARLTALFSTVFSLAVLLKFSIAAKHPQQYLVCKDIKTDVCLTWPKDHEDALRFIRSINPDFDYTRQCGFSQLSVLSPHQRFITVAPINDESANTIFCKIDKIIEKHPNDWMLTKMANSLYRARRQTPYSLRGRYRGQTQSQYLAIDHGNGKDEGKAEAHSAADSSRASVSGSSGMGQAQSQTMYDPSCDNCVGRAESEAESLKRRPYDSQGGSSGGIPIGGSNLPGTGSYGMSSGGRPDAHGNYGPNPSGRPGESTLYSPNVNGQGSYGPNLNGDNGNGALKPNAGLGSGGPGTYGINQNIPGRGGEYGPTHGMPNGGGTGGVAPNRNGIYGASQPGVSDTFRGGFPSGTSVHDGAPGGSVGYSPHQVGADRYPSNQNGVPHSTGTGNVQGGSPGGNGYGTNQGGGYSPPNQLTMPGFGSNNYGPGQHASSPSGNEIYGPNQSGVPRSPNGKEAFGPGQNNLQGGNGPYGPNQISGTGNNRGYGPSQGGLPSTDYIPSQQGTSQLQPGQQGTSQLQPGQQGTLQLQPGQIGQTASNGPYGGQNWPSTRVFSSPDGTTYYCCIAGPNNNPQYFKLDGNGLPTAGTQTGTPYGTPGQGSGSSVPQSLLSPTGSYSGNNKPFVSGNGGSNGPYGSYGTDPNQGNTYSGPYSPVAHRGPDGMPQNGAQYRPGIRDEHIGSGGSGPYGLIPSGGQSGITLPGEQRGLQGPGGIQGQGNLQGPGGLQGQGGLQGPGSLQGQGGLQGPGGLQGQGGLQGLGGLPGQGLQGPGGLQGQGGLQGPGGLQGQGGLQSPGSLQIPGGLQGQGGSQIPGGLQGQGGLQGPGGLQGQGGSQGPGGLQGQGSIQGPGALQGQGGLHSPGGLQGPGGMHGQGSFQGPGGYQGPGGLQGSGGVQGPGGIISGQNGVQGPGSGGIPGQGGIQSPGVIQGQGGLQGPGALMSPGSQLGSGSLHGPGGIHGPTSEYGSIAPGGGSGLQGPGGDTLHSPHGQYNPGTINGQNNMQGPNGGINSGQNGLQVPGGSYGSGPFTGQGGPQGSNGQYGPGSTVGQNGLPNQYIPGTTQNGYGTPTATYGTYGPGTADRQNGQSPYSAGQNIGPGGTGPYGNGQQGELPSGQTGVPNQYGTGQVTNGPQYGNGITGTGQYGNGYYGYNNNGKPDQNGDYAGIPQNVIDPNSIGGPIDGDDSEAEASVSQAANGTVATASSKGGNDKGRAQTHVHGAYTDSGSFSAQAEISGENKAANSEVTGNKKGASSNAQGSGRNNKSQANVQLGSETGSVLTGSQSQGTLHSSNTQVQGSVKGGMADAQARGPGSTSSQAQIGFTPYKEGDKSHELQKAPFIGGGTASAQSSGRTGSSQSQLRGTFKYGITYNGGAQAGASLDKDTVFPNRLPFDKIDVYDESNKNINVISESTEKSVEPVTENYPYSEAPPVTDNVMPVNQADIIPSTEIPYNPVMSTERADDMSRDSEIEYGIHTHSDHHKTDVEPSMPTRAPPVESRRSFHSTYSTNSGDYEYTTDKDENSPDDYDVDDGFGPEGTDATDVEQGEYSTYNEFSRDTEPTHQNLNSPRRKGLEVRQTTGGNTQHIVLGSLNNHDAEITQRNSERPDESRVYQPGERVPGTGGYTIPVGFTGSVKSVASKDKTYVVGSKDSPSQAQTVSLTPGRGKVKYTYPANYARNINPKNLRSLYQPKPDDSNRYVSVSKSVTRDLDAEDHIRKQYSHTYYTKSSSCGYFTFTCTMVSGAEGRKKVCKPKIPTNPDGTPMRC